MLKWNQTSQTCVVLIPLLQFRLMIAECMCVCRLALSRSIRPPRKSATVRNTSHYLGVAVILLPWNYVVHGTFAVVEMWSSQGDRSGLFRCIGVCERRVQDRRKSRRFVLRRRWADWNVRFSFDCCAILHEVADLGLFFRACSKIFKGKSVEKGIAFPTCVSVNQCATSNLLLVMFEFQAWDMMVLQLRGSLLSALGSRSPLWWRCCQNVRADSHATAAVQTWVVWLFTLEAVCLTSWRAYVLLCN